MNQIETFFDTMAERWDAVCVHDPGKIRTILDRTNLRQNARILDVGCGTGILESYLLPYEPRQIVAIDIAGQMIEKARMKYPDHPLIEFLQEDAMSYEGKGFDYIILYSAYPHFMRPERLIEHMSGLLAPGGKYQYAPPSARRSIIAALAPGPRGGGIDGALSSSARRRGYRTALHRLRKTFILN